MVFIFTMLYICLILVLIRMKISSHKKHFQNIEYDHKKINDDDNFNYTSKNDPVEIFSLFDLPNP